MKIKKLLSILLIGSLMFAFAACSSDNEEAEIPEETQQPSELVTGEPEEETVPEVGAPEDQDITGEWQDQTSQRAFMLIEGTNDKCHITILWGSSATEETEWTMTCTLDKNTGKYVYNDGVKNINTSDETGSTLKAEVYTGGSGEFTLSNGTITWKDNKDTTGKDCKFIKVK
ncbi:MAG: hypothetical protein PUB09_00640 [Firmicutes bacterium]|nr:hypothetical protein [Bacillota bacterium]